MTFFEKGGMIIYVAGDDAMQDENVRLAQLDRAFGYGPKGRGFESSNARYAIGCSLKESGFSLILFLWNFNDIVKPKYDFGTV